MPKIGCLDRSKTDSKSAHTYFSTNVKASLNLIVWDCAKILKNQVWIIKGFWYKMSFKASIQGKPSISITLESTISPKLLNW